MFSYRVSKEHREGLVTKTKAIRNKCKDDLRKVQNNFQRKARDKEAEHSMDLILKVVAKVGLLVRFLKNSSWLIWSLNFYFYKF